MEKLNFPERITIEFTNHCNLNCPMCPRRFMTYKKGFMKKELFYRIVEMLEGKKLVIVPFFRGESFLHPNFLEFIQTLKNRLNAKIQLATNATLLTPEISKKLIDLQIDFMSFSIDVCEKNTYQILRKGANFDLVIHNIMKFIEIKNKMKSEKPEIQISAVRTKFNSHLIPQFVKNWLNFADRVRIYEEHSKDGKFGKLTNSNFGERKLCFKPFREMVIYWNGKVALCNHDWDRKKSLGDLNYQDIEEIWNGESYERIRRIHIEGRWWEEPVCAYCDHWKMYCEDKKLIGELYVRS